MNIVFLGNAPWSVPSLEALAASSHRPSLVVTRSARPAGRGGRLARTPVAQAADRLGLPLEEVDTVKSGSGFEALAEARPDVLVVVAYGEILPARILELPVVAPLNLHFSMLPKLRGPAPVQRAILEGVEVTGVTTIRMDEGVDTGPVLLQADERILPDDDAGSLGSRLAALGGRVLIETLDGLREGTLRERAQDEGMATYAPKVAPEDRVIEWNGSAEAIVRQVRAMSPQPGAETRYRGKVLKVFRASARHQRRPLHAQSEPGTLWFVQSDDVGGPRWQALQAFAGDGLAVVLEEVALEGRKRMSGVEFFRGSRQAHGERLG